MVEAIITLVSIAASIGIPKALDWIETKVNQKKEITSNDVLQAIKTITNEARTKGSDVLNKINNKIMNIHFPYSMSGQVKDYLTKIKNENTKLLNKTQSDLTKVENKLNLIDEQASTLANQPESTRNILKDQINTIKDDAKDQLNQVNDIIQGVENKINE